MGSYLSVLHNTIVGSNTGTILVSYTTPRLSRTTIIASYITSGPTSQQPLDPSLRLAQSTSCVLHALQGDDLGKFGSSPICCGLDWSTLWPAGACSSPNPGASDGASVGSCCQQVPLLSSGPSLADPAA
ncbi:hypothetical protein PCASD_26369 [Puccinia coronata f. sp. avenae]|uniref:Uncharacterized protein n=1 Tax=Puccinia coronata f. sp. avenae TaxID=200324 RepID=A0A2N5TKK5_9BASI|nr:hypothetical protein PCASD_26369 [Puccinia coronata f. sp. avenae]